MPQPTPFHRSFSFNDFQAESPSVPLPGYRVDAQLDGIENTLTGVLGNLALIQRDDGKLRDGAVTIDSVSAELLAAITGTDGEDGVSPPNPVFTIVTNTLAPGAAATVALSGAYPNLTLTLGVPKGDPAAPGAATLEDGVYGQLTVSGGGTIFTIDNVAVADVVGLTAALDAKIPKTGGALTGLLASTYAGGFGYSHNRAASPGQAGNHFYNGGGSTEWLTYQPAPGAGHDYRIATLIAGVVSDHLVVDQSGYVTILGTNAAIELRDRDGAGGGIFYHLNGAVRLAYAGGGDVFSVDGAGNGAFLGGLTAGGHAVALDTDIAALAAALAGKQPAGAYATTAALAGKSDAITTILDFNVDVGLVDGHNDRYLLFTGAVTKTVSFGDLQDGMALILANRGTANLTISCAGGYFKNGGAVSAANFTLAPNGKISCFHEGGGVWTFDGTGVP